MLKAFIHLINKQTIDNVFTGIDKMYYYKNIIYNKKTFVRWYIIIIIYNHSHNIKLYIF